MLGLGWVSADECEAAAKSDLTQMQCNGGRSEAIWRERSEQHRRRAEAAKADLPGVEHEIAKLEREEAVLRERAVQP